MGSIEILVSAIRIARSYQVLTACSFTVSEECEMKLNSLIDSKRRTVGKFLISLVYLQLFSNAIVRRYL